MAKEVGDYVDEVLGGVEPTTWQDANKAIQQAILNLGIDRQRQYGSGNIAKFGSMGVIIRSTDKLERLTTMVFGSSPKDQLKAIDDILAFAESEDADPKELLNKIANLRKSTVSNTQESIEDSFGDLGNYGIYGVMLERGWWALPLV